MFRLEYHSSSSSPSPITLLRALLFHGKIRWTNFTSSLLTRSRRFLVADRTFFVPVIDVELLVELETVWAVLFSILGSGVAGMVGAEPATDDLLLETKMVILISPARHHHRLGFDPFVLAISDPCGLSGEDLDLFVVALMDLLSLVKLLEPLG